MSTPKTLNNAETALLGLLSEREAHAYAIRKEIREHSMDYWTELSKSSIYKTLKLLESKGHVGGESSLGEKNVGRRTYRITESGRNALLATLRAFLSEPEKEIWRIDLATANLAQVPRDELPELLAAYETKLRELVDGYRRLEAYLLEERCPAGNLALARRPLALYSAELVWLDGFRQSLGIAGRTGEGVETSKGEAAESAGEAAE